MDRKMLFLGAALFCAVFAGGLAAPSLSPVFKGGFATAQTDAEQAMAAGKLEREDAEAVHRLAKLGMHLTLAELAAIKTDTPVNGAYAAYTEIAASPWEAVNPMPADTKPHKALCYSLRDGEQANHVVIYYNADYFYDMGVDLFGWVRSGCAAALQRQHNTSDRLVFFEMVKRKIPNTPQYEIQRRSWASNMYMACNAEARKRGVPSNAAGPAAMDCRKRSGL